MSNKAQQAILDFKLRDDATFSNYIGDAAKSLKQTRGMAFVWGEPGSGKSHLLQAFCHDQSSSIYLSDLLQLDVSMLRGLESLALVCIDDVDLLVAHKDWQEALFHLINDCHDSGTLLVFSSSSPAAKLDCQLKDLQTRLIGIVAIETSRLSDENRLTALKMKAANHGFEFTDEVGRFILARAGRDMNSLVSMFERLSSETLREQRKVTIPFVKQVLGI
ncbi:MAG: DnaA family protein [Candidatus Azotimanducaceae bacterium]|jgi:DnaA family protein